ncbi:MAG: M10 family metallopeptidase C-terminal domain-containing protein [Devosia sp.]|nr:M10 family metallopeptidase C-terminal domain-containing protein [Devosia sp.]
MAAIASVVRPSDPYTNALLGDYKWASGNLTYSFPTSSAAYNSPYYQNEPNSILALNATQQNAAEAAFANYAAVANVTFTELTGGDVANATLRLAMSNAPGTAWAYFPNTIAEGGDAWFNKSDYNNPIKGNYAYATFIHEIGHALGLDHPHQNGMPYDRDSMEYSVMTYRSYIGASTTSGYTNETWGYAQSLMMYDIAAVQQMYGANFSTNNGNTTYSWSPTTGELSVNGVGQGPAGGNKIFQTVWDGGGNDTYDFSNYTTNLTVDLRPGAWTTTSSAQLANLHYTGSQVAEGNIANALQYNGDPSSLIENAIGGSGHDTIIGNAAANLLRGNSGNDSLFGMEGNDFFFSEDGSDHMDGGSGLDYVDYSGVATAMTVSLHYAGWNTGVAAGDSYAGIEGLLLGSASDVAYGDAASNYIYSGSGHDTVFGFGEQDFLFGQDGDDNLMGDDGHDHLFGGLGADLLQGGSGFDYVRYDDANYADFIIALGGQVANTGAAAGDTFIGIESFVLGSGSDVAYGNTGDNYIYGRGGNDTLYGMEGHDTLFGEAGRDRFIFDTQINAANSDVIGDFVSGYDSLGLAHYFFGGADAGGGEVRFFQGVGITGAAVHAYLGAMLFDTLTSVLSFDADGAGAGEAVTIATLTGVNHLTGSDFFFV